ncbi:tRNA (adenine(58)-N(1))-methyltransferase non-catalytic subunit TRM6-like [Oncorhynchus masou masou]|uniref:tRNA (adenine(58)-N(1))-methyltransferase non-catalytic subunit TRM6-like n=1 Tax=Oncorhynchus masou masou TaxID=90313 RepID=UPI0031842F99
MAENQGRYGYGSVMQMYPGGGPAKAGAESFGFPSHFHDMLHELPICHVNALLAGTLDTEAKDIDMLDRPMETSPT